MWIPIYGKNTLRTALTMGKIRRRRKPDLASQVEDRLQKTPKKESKIGLIPTGSTLLNLVLSDQTEGGFQLGKIENLIGDSSSGKTFIALSMLTECCLNPNFENYQLIYDDVEAANEFDIEELFSPLKSRITAPSYQEDEAVYSDTVQQFHDHVLDALDSGQPFIYVLDSLDALDSEEDQKKVEEQRKARAKGNQTAGTYGMSKPKAMSWMLKNLKAKFKKSKSMLLVISQTRDNINPMSFEKKTRSGGRALKFYACHEVWMALGQKLRTKGRIAGIQSKIKCSKNKLTGKIRECEFPIHYDYGIDDIASMIDFLVQENHWKKRKQTIIATEFEVEAGRQKLIEVIEEKELETELREICQVVWTEIEDSLKLNRKKKYS